jgi:glycosyltransferase involved in cell wall biosynthesis
MKSLCIFSQYFYPDSASTAQLMTDLAKGFAEKGFTTSVFTASQTSESTLPLEGEGIWVSRSATGLGHRHSVISKIIDSILFLAGGIFYVLLRLDRNTPLLIASNPPYAGIIGILFSVVKGGKYYFLLQDIFPESAVLANIVHPGSPLVSFFNFLSRLTYRRSTRTVVLSQAMQDYLEQKTGLADKFTVIENWAIEEVKICPKDKNPFALEHSLDRKFTVLYSGNIGRLHDIEIFAETATLLKNDNIQFVFVGDGAKKQILIEAKQAHHLDNLLLLPFQPRDLLELSLTACDVSLVSLIAGAETAIAPCKLYGMMAAGRAIVSVSVPGSYLDQLLSSQRCGINCPPGQPGALAAIISNLAQQPQQVIEMGANARAVYENSYRFSRALADYQSLVLNSQLSS